VGKTTLPRQKSQQTLNLQKHINICCCSFNKILIKIKKAVLQESWPNDKFWIFFDLITWDYLMVWALILICGRFINFRKAEKFDFIDYWFPWLWWLVLRRWQHFCFWPLWKAWRCILKGKTWSLTITGNAFNKLEAFENKEMKCIFSFAKVICTFKQIMKHVKTTSLQMLLKWNVWELVIPLPYITL